MNLKRLQAASVKKPKLLDQHAHLSDLLSRVRFLNNLHNLIVLYIAADFLSTPTKEQPKPFSRTAEPGHYCARWASQNALDLPIAEAFDVAKHHDFPVNWR